MVKASSAVDICNLALGELGNGAIASIETPTTVTENICARHYDNTRRAVLRSHIWNFAKKRVVLARSSTPASDYTDGYPLPADYIRIIKVKSIDGQGYTKDDYDIANGLLLLNASGAAGVNFTYEYDCTLVGQYDPLFVKLLALNLAKDMSYEITRKNTVKESILSEINLIEGRIRGIDGQEKPPVRVERSRWLAVRRTLSNLAGKRYGF